MSQNIKRISLLEQKSGAETNLSTDANTNANTEDISVIPNFDHNFFAVDKKICSASKQRLKLLLNEVWWITTKKRKIILRYVTICQWLRFGYAKYF